MSSFYAIISDSGKAMFIDYGSASGAHFGNFETRHGGRPTASASSSTIIDELKRSYGLKSVDVAMPSHMHDDHINGFPHLMRQLRHQGLVLREHGGRLREPARLQPGLHPRRAVQGARTFRHGEKFRWEEFEFEVTHSPGHTEYQMAMYATIDGSAVAFTGDAFFASRRRRRAAAQPHLPQPRRERQPPEVDPQPDRARAGDDLPGHGRPYAVTRPLMARPRGPPGQQQFFFDLLPDGETDFGLDPSWV